MLIKLIVNTQGELPILTLTLVNAEKYIWIG